MPRPAEPPAPAQNPNQEQPSVTAAAMNTTASSARTASEGRDLQEVLYAILEAAERGSNELIYRPLQSGIITHLTSPARGFTVVTLPHGQIQITW